jgi:hypothetical protein
VYKKRKAFLLFPFYFSLIFINCILAGCFWRIREDSPFNRIFLPSPAEEGRLGEMFLFEIGRAHV